MFFKKSVIVAIALSLFLPFFSSAQTGDLRLTTSPLPINLKTTPGTTVTATLKIKNDGNQAEKLKIDLMKFKADPVTGAPILAEKEPGDKFLDWVTFSENKFTLPSNEWKTITATFNVPFDASFGYYYAVVFSRDQEQVNPADRQTVLTGGTATFILLEVDVPGAKKELNITDFSVNKSMFEFLPAVFSIKVRNTGNVHVIPRGNIFLSRSGNKDVATLDVNPNKGSILPDSPRNFESQWVDGFPVFQPDGTLKWDFSQASKLRFGKYTAKLLLVYDDGQRDVPIEAEVSFWVVPWRLIAIFVFNFALIVGLIMYVIRLRRRIKRMNKSQQ